ncbi:hypothetical protein CH275_06135 [Rhodococcus sp. 06-235-1A]|uniref:ACP S-malonyltransferase n=1 Tax=Rhodococcus sp. 06-235-1A TaxID=2022508 RepID=UPI000B9B7FBE|nr:ACP S-malonyltransferase [Rhodococcus sp. 06-235-1A]OZD08126.1 hypothetical protein CH275_06135 [Rhodococcus sp. 06-235-1A]
MIAIVAPGQGSQKPGMLAPWCDPAIPEARDVSALIDELSEAAGLDLRYFGTEAAAEEIVDTAVAQPLIVAFSLIGLASLGGAELPADETVFVGHSVGELTALAGCGWRTTTAAGRLWSEVDGTESLPWPPSRPPTSRLSR